ncbi:MULTISPECIES: TetR/AcrR family transcriptional regulator [Catenuloplanes]|uniref:AcrR family transcriptional regulator n=1 Tax=Catenuloplanes niger TaxID=587534 RepID=A0AAE3ZWA3_9ACTN|nr:TetR/AcrR family transcriptional regulator [Catenuloplanes niger]MDR7327244.1 AcrR family transcriptional regulator [Catenuloplanes niger]
MNQTRARLLRAAAELVVETGWGGVSTRLVAQRAGVPGGAVHYHFTSVDALLRESVAPALAALTAGLRAGLAASPGPRDGVRLMIRAVTDGPADGPGAILIGEVFLRSTRDPVLRADVAAVLAALRADLAGWLAGHGLGDRAAPVATVLTATLDALGLHRALDPALDLTGVEDTLLELIR